MWGHMGGYGWNGGWGWMSFGMIGMVLLWIVIIVAIVALVRLLWKSQDSPAERHESTALDILRERYARGDISQEEFERKKHKLGN